jgi:hypothetical protein
MDIDVVKGLDNVEKLIDMYSINGYSVGKRLTWADLFVNNLHNQAEYTLNFSKKFIFGSRYMRLHLDF